MATQAMGTEPAMLKMRLAIFHPPPFFLKARCISVATGSPLDGIDDTRRRYQQIYHYAAEAVREPARLAIAELQSAPGRVAALLNALVNAARSAGDRLMPISPVEVAMGTREGDRLSTAGETEQQDLSWNGIVRIRIVSVTPGGAGQILVIPGKQRVTAFLEVDGTKVDKVTVSPGEHPEQISWEAEETAKLILISEDGRKIELPLFQAPETTR